MLRGAGTAVTGVGLTIVSTFAPALGLTVHQQRVGFGVGLLLIVAGAAVFGYGHFRGRRRDSGLYFGSIEVGEPRPVRENNVFVENWNGAPVVFNLINPHGNPRARDIRPTVVVQGPDGEILAGPANGRWANPQSPSGEEVERDIPANGAPVAIDTVIQEVMGATFWLVTDDGLKKGLKANGKAIKEPRFEVTVTVQGENVRPISKTVSVCLGFPVPAIHGPDAVQDLGKTFEFPTQEERDTLSESEHVPDKTSKPLGPEERREALDNMLYPPADPRRELGEECANFAITLTAFNEEQEARKEHATARYVQEIREANPELDPFEVRKSAEAHFDRQVEATYKAEMQSRALRLFDEAREQEAIAEKVRRSVERPLAVELGDTPNLFLAIARRLGEDPVKYRWPPTIPLPTDLPAQIDDLMREGMDLVKELDAPVESQKVDGGWKVEGGDAPDAWWEKADDFQQRNRTLLVQQHPALLTDFRDGYNGHLKKEREAEKPDPADDKRSDAEKILGLANYERSGPRRVVEANLEGLAAARHRLGFQEAA